MTAKPHFSIFGVPIRIELLFWVITGVIGYSLGDARLVMTWIAVVFVSILVHELGHAIAFRIFGRRASVVLHGFGGLTFSDGPISRGQDIVVSLAGPFSALLLLGLPARFLRDSDIGRDYFVTWVIGGGGFGIWPILEYAAYINIWWSLFNLLPIRPLDGGHVVTAVIGLNKARIVSIVFGAGAAVYAFLQEDRFQFVAFFAAMLAFINFSEYQRARSGAPAPSAFDIEPPTAARTKRAKPSRRGKASLRAVPPPTAGFPTAPPMAQGIDPESAASLAWNAVRSGNANTARRTINRSSGPVSPFLIGTIEVIESGSLDGLVDAYAAEPDGPSNLVPATTVADADLVGPLVARLLDTPAGITAASSLQTHLHYAERYAEAAVAGGLVYASSPPSKAQTAFDVACSLGRTGDIDGGLAWIERAIGDGFHAPAMLDGESDLAAIRADPRWAELRARLG